ncbi:hypothetical protein [Brevibacillus sp. SAFN-007a]|uniref:hypothetical protein n=1 Tax=Brevibacillus sp. SAFN-007a TaxID=3436862 RepID=UPI003F805941
MATTCSARRISGRSQPGLIFIALVALLLVDRVPLLVIDVLIVIAGMLSPLSTAGAQTLLPRLLAFVVLRDLESPSLAVEERGD